MGYQKAVLPVVRVVAAGTELAQAQSQDMAAPVIKQFTAFY